MPLAAGEVFAGYTVVRLLGTGGMGEVYLARHPRLPRQEALKILPARVSADVEFRQRFEREADIAASLWHPHVVTVHDRGEHNGQLWISMDYVEGTDAAALLRARYPGGMPAQDVLGIVAAIADALDYAHERGLLHRDVKPANILIADPHLGERRILLADFGIAKGVNETNGLTATNMTVGSVAYAAPEQLMGKVLDGHADQYALAGTAFHLLAGRPPFADSNPAVVMSNHLSAPPPRLGGIRRDLGPLDDVVATAMAKEPLQRFGSCREFSSALARAAEVATSAAADTRFAAAVPPPAGGSAAPTSVPTWVPTSVPTSRRAAWIVGGVAALLAVGLVAFLGARLAQRPLATPGSGSSATQTVRTWQGQGPASTMTGAEPGAPPQTTPAAEGASGDLGLAIPISHPHCNGQGVVILGSVTTPGLYAAGVQRLLDAHPGAFYLRTDRSCPSLRQATAEGNPIYAVFVLGGSTPDQLCAAVRAAGGDAYGKWLDTTTDPGYIVPC